MKQVFPENRQFADNYEMYGTARQTIDNRK